MSNQELEYKVLKWLEKNPNITQRQLAKELGVSLGKTHYLINSLIKVGWVKLDNFKRSQFSSVTVLPVDKPNTCP